jgi:hypothetical protein
MVTHKINWARFADLISVGLLLSVAVMIAWPRWRAGIDWRDEGLLAYGAVRVAAGDIPNRDFVSLQPPLSYYFCAALFKAGGTSLATLRILGLAIFVALPGLIYVIARNFIGNPIVSFAAAVPACVLGMPYVYFVPLAAWQGIAASLAAVAFFIPAALSPRRWLALPAGFLTGVSLFLRHDQALYTVVAIVVYVIALNFACADSILKRNLQRAFFLWLVGIGVIALPFMVFWWRAGALQEMFNQLVVFPFATYRQTSALPFPKLSAATSLQSGAVLALYYLPLVVQFFAGLYLVKSFVRGRFRTREAAVLFLLVWSALYYLQVLVRSDQNHLLMTLPPVFLLSATVYSIGREKIASRRAIDLTVCSFAAILVACFLWILRPIALPDVSQATDTLALDRGGIRVEQAPGITGFVKAVQGFVPPSRSILALPYQPMFYFLCDRRNPTRWNYLWPGDQTPSDHAAFVEQAERDPPAVILLSDEREVSGYAAPVLAYVERHYTRTDRVGRITIYVRREGE